MTLLARVFTDLGMLALEVREDGSFIPINTLPHWLQNIADIQDVLGALAVRDLFPFIDNFMVDAAEFWRVPTHSRLASGVWTEVDTYGKQYQLEAYAMVLCNTRILVLQDLTESFESRRHVYQRAREIALNQEKVVNALQRQQRKLQWKLQSLMSEATPINHIAERIQDYASAVMVCKPDGSVELLNQALMDIYPAVGGAIDFSKQSLLNKWISEAEHYYPEISRILRTGSYWEGEFETAQEAGVKKWVRLIIGPVKDQANKVSHLICIANDITGIRAPSLELEKVTDYDFTTQLPNRRQFWRVLTRMVDECRASSEKLLLLYLDLDRFKQVNDNYDHQCGDMLLSALSARLQRNIKKTDFIAHLGCDEFAIVMRTQKRHQDIAIICERLLKLVNQPVFVGERELNITASIGVTIFPDDAADAVTLMKNADLAMYHAKRTGRNQFQHYTQALNEAFADRVLIQRDISSALANGELYLVYQPQLMFGANTEVRLEALLRWQHPQRGAVSPALFIPLVEETDFINVLGNWVLRKACAQAQRFSKNVLPVVVAVNVSPCQLRSSDFYEQVCAALRESGLPPAQLELEITESVLLDNFAEHVTALRRLQALGVSIALDDFGSGFSSLNYLKNLPVDRLKIDQVFIREIPRDQESKTITMSIVKLAHELRLKVVAEGVEQPEQLDFLKSIGCDYVQGYLLFKPLPPERVPDIMKRLAEMAL